MSASTRERGLPLLGSTKAFHAEPKQFLLELFHRHGDVAQFTLAGQRFLLVAHPADVIEVLRDADRFPKWELRWVRLTLKDGMFMSEGERWKTNRRVFQPYFRPRDAVDYVELIATTTERLSQRWSAYAREGRQFDASVEYMGLMIDVAGRLLLGPTVTERDRQTMIRVAKALPPFNDRNASMPFLSPRVPFPWNREMRTSIGELDENLDHMIARRRRIGPIDNDVLSRVIADGSTIEPAQLRDELIGLLVGSFESSYGTLSWATELLTRHANWQPMLQREADAVLGGRPVRGDDIKNLAIARRVVDETLRLFPAFPFTARLAREDSEIRHHRVRAGTRIIISPWVTHRHPEFWDEPERFDPDRFLAEPAEQRPLGSYLPFGEGPRVCIGKSLALTELPAVLVTLLRAVTMQRSATSETQPAAVGIPLRPEGGVWITVRERKSAGANSAGDSRAQKEPPRATSGR